MQNLSSTNSKYPTILGLLISTILSYRNRCRILWRPWGLESARNIKCSCIRLSWHLSLRALEDVLCHISNVELLQAIPIGIRRRKNLMLHCRPLSLILALASTFAAASVLIVSLMTCCYAVGKVGGFHGCHVGGGSLVVLNRLSRFPFSHLSHTHFSRLIECLQLPTWVKVHKHIVDFE